LTRAGEGCKGLIYFRRFTTCRVWATQNFLSVQAKKVLNASQNIARARAHARVTRVIYDTTPPMHAGAPRTRAARVTVERSEKVKQRKSLQAA